ncbi:hypothetical protein ABRT01_08975 [Lentibacillus sp. L22]|nr:hypothetical protein [Lentibacillus daqui]
MKKIIATVALGALLATGFLFTQDNSSDLAMDREPGVLSISSHGSSF